MLNIEEMVVKEIENGYGNLNAQAKVCQNIILKAIAESPFNQNITIKGGVVMRSKTKNVRRATQDIDMDFLRYSLSDKAIDEFISTINCIDGIQISRFGKIEELKQQEYKGKRVYVQIKDLNDFSIECKIDVGVHGKLDVCQEEYCFDIAFDDEGASLLVNSNEQMFAEKTEVFIAFWNFSTRFKDVFDMYYLKDYVDPEKLNSCLDAFVFSDKNMRENDITDIRDRVRKIFSDNRYLSRLASSDKNWIGDNIGITTKTIVDFLSKI